MAVSKLRTPPIVRAIYLPRDGAPVDALPVRVLSVKRATRTHPSEVAYLWDGVEEKDPWILTIEEFNRWFFLKTANKDEARAVVAQTIEWLANLERTVGRTVLLDAMPNNYGGRVAIQQLAEVINSIPD